MAVSLPAILTAERRRRDTITNLMAKQESSRRGRRKMLGAMVAASALPLSSALPMDAAPAEAAADEPSTIYIPDRHRETDLKYLQQFFADYSFAMVITTEGGLHVTNVPTLWSPGGGEWGTLWWHIAKNNIQNQPLTAGAETTLIFQSPHSYISPNWYDTKNSVPTWNFATVHCTGKPVRIQDDEKLAAGLARLVQTNEEKYGGGEWKYQDLPAAYLKGMRLGIVGYEMAVQRVEAKFKLGQERTAADKAKMLSALRAGKGAENRWSR